MNQFLNYLIKKVGINAAGIEIVGANLVGLLPAAMNSTNAGGWMDPDFIQGYRFNPADSKWYSTPPSPFYGNYAWSNPASGSMQATLNQIQTWRNQSNQVEGATPTNGAAGGVTPVSVFFDILPNLPKIAARYLEIGTPYALDAYYSLKGAVLGSSSSTPVPTYNYSPFSTQNYNSYSFDRSNSILASAGLFAGTTTVAPASWVSVSGYNGKKAFYEVVTKEDFAPSIASKTGVLLNSAGQSINTFADAWSTLDTNGDGKLTGTELSSLQMWNDSNEDGIANSGEINALQNLGLSSLSYADYYFATQNSRGGLGDSSNLGNTKVGGTDITASNMPGAYTLNYSTPVSNYRSLRDTDNTYWITTSNYINWNSAQIKINNQTRDTLIGTDGNDSFDVNYYNAYSAYFDLGRLTKFMAGNGDDVVGGSTRDDQVWGGTGNDVVYGYEGNDSLYGEEGSDQLQGGSGNDLLDGGIGIDTLFGQVGNDILVGGDGDDLLMGFTASNEAKQTLNAGETDDDFLFGGAGNDTLYGGLGNDVLDGGTGLDNLNGGLGEDKLFGGLDSDMLNGNEGNDQLLGDAGNDTIWGGVGNDQIWGGEGDDTLLGFTPSNDTKQTLTLVNGLMETDNDTIYGGFGNDNIFGGLGDDALYGDEGADQLSGGDGHDSLWGGVGNDTLFGQVGNDQLWGGDGDDTLMGFTAANDSKQTLAFGEADNDYLYGGAGIDTLYGGLGNDYLDGGMGADKLIGGVGDDTYVVNTVNDTIIENANEGFDTVLAASNYILNANIENLRLLDGANYSATGNSLDNTLFGNRFDNELDGVTGADTLIGGLGNDTYTIDNLGDEVIEYAGEGIDTVLSKININKLADNIENAKLLDFSDAENGLIDGVAVKVYGQPKANELDYAQGNAVVNYQGTCALTAIANLVTQSGKKTTEADVINLAISKGWCNTNPTIDASERGSTSYVTQQSLLDTYGIPNTFLSGYNGQAMANLVQSGRSVLLAVNAGKLWNGAPTTNYDFGVVDHVVTVTGVVKNAQTNALMGFYIADSGRGKVEDMARYISAADLQSAGAVGLAYSIYTQDPIKLWDERLSVIGNSLDNTLIGNRTSNNFNGGAGNDTLIGGLGNDGYYFEDGGGMDTIIDTDSTVGNEDLLAFRSGFRKEHLWFSKSGANNTDLAINVIGTKDGIIVKDWYKQDANGALVNNTASQIEKITTAWGNTLTSNKVDALVQAMAAFTPPPMGQTNLGASYQSVLNVIAASWA
jgi:Ca2+-binding RTX toxin-like protein